MIAAWLCWAPTSTTTPATARNKGVQAGSVMGDDQDVAGLQGTRVGRVGHDASGARCDTWAHADAHERAGVGVDIALLGAKWPGGRRWDLALEPERRDPGLEVVAVRGALGDDVGELVRGAQKRCQLVDGEQEQVGTVELVAAGQLVQRAAGRFEAADEGRLGRLAGGGVHECRGEGPAEQGALRCPQTSEHHGSGLGTCGGEPFLGALWVTLLRCVAQPLDGREGDLGVGAPGGGGQLPLVGATRSEGVAEAVELGHEGGGASVVAKSRLEPVDALVERRRQGG